ncbi:circadian clock protein KaiC [Actinopolymorpha cephalotaxi]|uniref:non-specific serine/threonine protein kinase n=1 Tax=Actinopolymorpha cephalotaxi TaxID=504797 RepID=A0A1I2ZS39_9ACTN|nr:circadian clock protein KaiC [Actinopolymorpha cephalotaxi]NYH84138.1 circadian clock protein KaiC [Actinopolymorpha cephalotaxi]SFH40628.1 circadian clock protein KaiC [Actinopolymorpha cephalotaxi]
MTNFVALERVPTGISGFDEVAVGGLPAGRCCLVSGTTGSGKTLFSIEFLARGILDFGDHGVFVTFEETADDIRRNAASLGFAIEEWEAAGKWAFVDASAKVADEAPTIGEYDFGGLLAQISAAARRINAKRVSIDSIGAVFSRFPLGGVVRYELFRIVAGMEQLGVTTVVTTERNSEYDGVSRHNVEEFVVDNVIILRNYLAEQRRRRTVEIVKLRGAQHRSGEWLFTIDPERGLVVIPMAYIVHRPAASSERVSSGIPGLDAMCGGGFFRDAIVLITGPTGTGKTLTSLQFIAEGVRAGERCLLYTFDETREQLNRNASGWGLDLNEMEASGLLRVNSEYPETAAMEDHFMRLWAVMRQFRPHRLALDTLSALERIGSPRALLDFVISLGSLLRQGETTALLTSAPSATTGRAGPPISVEIASFTDATILYRYVETPEREIQRAIAVVQTRGSTHDHAIRKISIDEQGMHIGDRLPSLPGGGVSLPENPQWPISSGPPIGGL